MDAGRGAGRFVIIVRPMRLIPIWFFLRFELMRGHLTEADYQGECDCSLRRTIGGVG